MFWEHPGGEFVEPIPGVGIAGDELSESCSSGLAIGVEGGGIVRGGGSWREPGGFA